MKKLTLLLFVAKALSNKVTINIDFGQSTKLLGSSKKQFSILEAQMCIDTC